MVDFHKSFSVLGGSESLFLLDLFKQKQGDILYIAANDIELEELLTTIKFFDQNCDIATFPAWDCLPYDRVSPSQDIVGKRIDALVKIVNSKKQKIILTTIKAAVQKLVPKEILKNAGFAVEKSTKIDLEKLKLFLSENGYIRVEVVRDVGEFALRGGIIDIYPPSEKKPVRIDLFGDEVEDIKYFDTAEQISINSTDKIYLRAVSEIFLNDKRIKNFRSKYKELFGAIQKKGEDPLYEAVSEGRKFAGLEHWLPLFYDKMENIFDYIENPTIVFKSSIEKVRQEYLEQIYDFYEARLETLDEKTNGFSSPYKAIPVGMLFLEHKNWENILKDISKTNKIELLEVFSAEDSKNNFTEPVRDFTDVRLQKDKNLYAEVVSYIKNLQKSKKRIIVAGYSNGSISRLRKLFKEYGLKATEEISSWASAQALNNNIVAFSVFPIARGYQTKNFAIITEQDILGDRLVRQNLGKKSKRKMQDILHDLTALNNGDYVVHEEHGIGKFSGLETLTVGKISHDFIKIIYAAGDKLFVPVENLDLLSKYGNNNTIVALDKLGSAAWQARKAKVKKNLLEIAEELMEIAAKRVLKKADKLKISNNIYLEFAAKFPYPETEDQERAILEVLEDLNKDQAMDRLICGDVGFGKTEVAIRAAFVAAMSGTQVAILAPTTLLCRQHFQNFFKRFKNYDIRVEQLSRLVKPKDTKDIIKAIKNGDVNIVIGTHALLSEKIEFNHLGLVIIDEEQRFGVKQKERLKKLREQAHILTMTATPIPRTLQLSMAGVRDMSLIATPPTDRLAVRSFVTPFDSVVLREALMREHNRGGQSFYVCPRIADISKIEKQLQEMVPELKYVVAHGRMNSADLEERIEAFYDGKYDILLSTTIIESGLDIPNANTMIIHRADMFGLAQLHQIRGRIGRAKQRAYAYLTYSNNKPLTKTALQRLQVIDKLDMLGAGFQLASHDLDIRGAGNLLGEDQSGHVREVGVELYQKMLEEAVADIRSQKLSVKKTTTNSYSPEINLGISVMIPETYVADLHLRLSLYRRLGELKTNKDIEGFAAELTDRFGAIPDEVENLFETIKIKQLCIKAGVEKLEVGPKGAVITFKNNEFKAVDKLIEYISNNLGTVKLKPDQTLVYIRSWFDPKLRVNGSKRILKELVDMCEA